jgi:hypothetical protein
MGYHPGQKMYQLILSGGDSGSKGAVLVQAAMDNIRVRMSIKK